MATKTHKKIRARKEVIIISKPCLKKVAAQAIPDWQKQGGTVKSIFTDE
jgi:hypothetical protein